MLLPSICFLTLIQHCQQTTAKDIPLDVVRSRDKLVRKRERVRAREKDEPLRRVRSLHTPSELVLRLRKEQHLRPTSFCESHKDHEKEEEEKIRTEVRTEGRKLTFSRARSGDEAASNAFNFSRASASFG